MNASNFFDTFFTPSMGGLNLGFSMEDQKLAETVHSIAFEEIRKASELYPDCETEDEQAEKIELSKRNLSRIFELLEKSRDAREEFMENFPDWSVLRQDTIQKLNEIEQTIQKERFWCNLGKIAGYTTSGFGALAIASVLIFPPAAPVAALPTFLSGIASFVPTFLLPAAPAVVPSLVINGGIAAGVGGVSAAGSKVAELALLRKRMETANKVLQGDKRAFVYMENWFKHTKELIDAIEDFIGFDVIKQLYEDMNVLFVGINELTDLKTRSPLWLKAVIRFCVRQVLSGKISSMCLGAGLKAIFVTFQIVVFFLSKQNRFIFKCIIKTKQLMNTFCIDTNTVQELTRIFVAVTVGGSSAIEYLTVEAIREYSIGVFSGLGLAISAANIVLTSIDIKKGSTCKQREELKKVIEKLQEELDLLQKVYDAVDTGDSHSVSVYCKTQDSE